jgi:hypothetical protein
MRTWRSERRVAKGRFLSKTQSETQNDDEEDDRNAAANVDKAGRNITLKEKERRSQFPESGAMEQGPELIAIRRILDPGSAYHAGIQWDAVIHQKAQARMSCSEKRQSFHNHYLRQKCVIEESCPIQALLNEITKSDRNCGRKAKASMMIQSFRDSAKSVPFR